MRFKLITLLAVGLFGIQSAHAVVIDGREWRQLTETTNVSWLIVNNACGSGVCSGSIGDVSVDGWHWADNSDVQGLFETLIKPGTTQFPTSTTSYFAPGDADIATAVTSVFDPTWIFNLGANQYREVRGLSRSLTGGQATMAYLSDSPFATPSTTPRSIPRIRRISATLTPVSGSTSLLPYPSPAHSRCSARHSAGLRWRGGEGAQASRRKASADAEPAPEVLA